MRDLVRLIVWMVADLFRSRTALEVEVWMLRQQINVLRRTAPKKHRAGFRLYWRCKSKARGWQADSAVGETQAYPAGEHCQSAGGSASDPWRNPQARHRYRTDQRGHVHGQATRPCPNRKLNLTSS